MIPTYSFTAEEIKFLLSQRTIAEKRLLGNVRKLESFPQEVLLVGAYYPGIWLEHNQDNEFLTEYNPEAAWASQELFINKQREDGLLPFCFWAEDPWRICTGQIQCVRSFVRCALNIAQQTQRPEYDFWQIYNAGCRYEAWLRTNRNRAGTGLVEMYCEYDTGHDHNPRVTDGDIPCSCPEDDAGNMPNLNCMPILSVDLSAMSYDNRLALAELADALGKPSEASLWRSRAAELKEAIQRLLYDPKDDFYYDRGPQGFRRYRTEHLTRLFLNGVTDQDEFDRLYEKWMDDPNEFRTAYPYPAVSISDKHFNWDFPPNCWGSNSQALTAVRALIWLRRFGREKERRNLLMCHLRSALDNGITFPQELNPFTGIPIGNGRDYTPAIILFLEGLKELKKEKGDRVLQR